MSSGRQSISEDLRLRAEALVAKSIDDFKPEDLKNVNKLVHELAVHHAELELQNEELQQTQLKLQQVRDRYVALFEHAPVGYVVLDASGIIRQTNNTFNSMLGQSGKDFRGAPFTGSIVEQDIPVFLSRFRAFFRNPANKQIVTRLKRIGDTPIYAQIDAQPHENAPSDSSDESQSELMITVSDITGRKQDEEAIRESEAYLRGILETTIDGFWVIDHKGCVVEVNEAYCTMSGYSHKELIGMSIGDLDAEEKPKETQERIKRIIRNGSEIFKTKHRKKDGSVFPVELSVSFLKERGGQFICFCRDLSQRKRDEERLAVLGKMLDDAPASITIHNTEGRFVFANNATASMHGYESKAEFLKINLHDLDVPESEALLEERFKRIAEEGETQFEVEHFRKDGSTFPLEVLAKRIEWEGDAAILSIATDITERAKAEMQIRESESLYRYLFDAHTVVKLLVDPDTGDIIDANASAVDYYGWPRQTLLSKKIFDLNTLSVEKTKLKMEQARKGEQTHFEFRHRRADGSERNVEVFSNAIVIKGKQYLYSIIHDVTNRHYLEEQLRQSQKMDAIGRLAGGVAHDFNNMLSVIIATVELTLSSVEQNTPIYEDLLEINSAAQRSAELTRQLLGFSRKQVIKPRILNLNKVVEDQKKMLERLIGEDIHIKLTLNEDLWNVFADPAQMDQVLTNLSVNARDAIGGVGTLSITSDNVLLAEGQSLYEMPIKSGEYVLLSITDTGHGMDAETIEHIFEPFFTTKDQGEGTGLGLATVYGIVKQNNGFMHVDSEPEQGTTFKIYLPRYVSERLSVDKVETQKIVGGNEIILVVEDEESILKLTRRILERNGYTVLSTASPEEAISITQNYQGKIHLLLSDVVMPRMNGAQLKEELKKVNPKLRTLFMSGYTADVIAQRGVLGEEDEFIQKPFTMGVLAQRVREVLDKK